MACAVCVCWACSSSSAGPGAATPDAAQGTEGSAGGQGGSGGALPDAGNDVAQEAASPGASLGSFQLTYYWVTTEDEFSGAKDTSLYDASCNELAKVTAQFAASLKLEGTGRLSDGRILNYDGGCSCPTSPCYLVADAQHPWGYGVQGRALTPFRSIAVDTSVIAIGTPLYVAELDGVTMPGDAPWGSFVHDGCVVADDVGGGINGKHIDFFSALKQYYTTLDGQLGLTSVTVHEGGDRCP